MNNFDRIVLPRYNPRPMAGQHTRLPQQVNPFRLAAKEEHLRGALALRQMKRVITALESSEGEVLIDIVFLIDDNHVVTLSGQIKTEVKLICQRCMEEILLPIVLDIQLAFVRTEAEIDRLPEIYEVHLVDKMPVMLSDIIEDEIILALPAIPRHLNDLCHTGSWMKNGSRLAVEKDTGTDTGDVKRVNPFDVLASLKIDKQDEA